MNEEVKKGVKGPGWSVKIWLEGKQELRKDMKEEMEE